MQVMFRDKIDMTEEEIMARYVMVCSKCKELKPYNDCSYKIVKENGTSYWLVKTALCRSCRI